MIRKKNSRLTHKERIQIETLLNENKSKAYIAKTLHRSRSTITREVNKCVQSDKDKYSADLAHWNAKDDYLNKRNMIKFQRLNNLNFMFIKDFFPTGLQNKLREK